MSCSNFYYSALTITGDCSNTGSGGFTIDFTSDAGTTFSYVWNSPYVGSAGTFTTQYVVTGLTGGTYSFTVSDSTPCYLPVQIYISTGSCVNIDDVIHTTCSGNNGSITASTTNYYNGSAEFYLYETTNGFIQSATTFGEAIFSNLSAGTYYVIGDDGGGCTGKSESCIIKSSSTLNFGLYAVADGSCSASTDSGKVFITGLTGTPPYTYSWSTTPVQTTQNATGLSGNNIYSVTVTDSSGCAKSGSIFVPLAQPLGFVAYTSNPPTCFNSDGEVTIFISGGTSPYFYSGNNGYTAVSFAPTYTFTGISAGNFSVYIVDSGLCTFTSPILPLTTPNTFSTVVVSTTNSTCSSTSGSISVNVVGGVAGTTYTFTLDDGTTQTSVNVAGNGTQFNNLPSGTYTLSVNVLDDTSCVLTQTVVINNVDLFTISANTTGTTCNLENGSVLVTVGSGGTSGYTYEIEPVAPASYTSFVLNSNNQQLFTNIPAGNYFANVTDSSIPPCTQTIPFTINPSDSVGFILVSTDTLVGNDGTVTAFITSGTPPFTLNWSPNVNGQTGTTLVGLTAGTYVLEVIDDNGCVFKNDVKVLGTNLISSYQTFNVCDYNFENNGLVLQKGLKQMLVEGFYDLTKNDINCILNQATFTIVASLGGNTKQETFFTGTTLNEYPTDNEWYVKLSQILISFEGVGEVDVNQETNQVSITSSCETNAPNLIDSQVTVNLLINYDISCVACIS